MTNMNRRSYLSILLTFFCLGMICQADADALKSRMAKRLSSLDTLRASGKVGENNKGFLTARTKLSSKDGSLINAENADRKQVYAMIAKRTGESALVVGQKRAASLRKLSKKGIWLQDAKGRWYRKQ